MNILESIVIGDTLCTGNDFRLRVNQAVSGFAAREIGPNQSIALLMRNDSPFLEATLAAQRLGAYAVPLNWHSTADELGYVLSDCKPSLLVAHSDLLTSDMRSVAGQIPILVVDAPKGILQAYRSNPAPESVGLERWAEWLLRWQPYAGPSQASPASLIYTSGTTGRPKGVKRAAPNPEQAAYTEQMRHILTDFDPESRVLVPAPLYHAAPNMLSLRALRIAKQLVLPGRFDAEAVLADIQRFRITHLYAVPTMFHRLLALDSSIRSRYDLSTLRFVLHAGGPCPVRVKRGMLDWIGPILYEYYGSTDVGPVTFNPPEVWLAHPGTVGQVLPGIQLEILDDNGNRLPPGEEGEIYVRAGGYPDFEYVGLPEARAKIQRGDLIASGDMGWLDAHGNLFLTDRKTDMIVSGGVNIYPAEIEAALLELPGVSDCAVFGIPDTEFGEAVAAIIEPEAGVELSAHEICESLRRRVASFKVPRHIEFCEDLPREETGKIRKRLLRAPYWAGSGRRI